MCAAVDVRRTGGIPVGIEHDETIGTDEIETAATGFAAEHEDEIRALEGNEGEIGGDRSLRELLRGC